MGGYIGKCFVELLYDGIRLNFVKVMRRSVHSWIEALALVQTMGILDMHTLEDLNSYTANKHSRKDRKIDDNVWSV